MNNKLYVGGISYDTRDEGLKEFFAQAGNVLSAQIIVDRATGRSKGFGFVEFDSDDSANAAMSALNSSEIEGRKIIVNEAKPPSEGGGGRGGYGGSTRPASALVPRAGRWASDAA
jgi:RNA recognition motif-containing protein